MQTGSLTHSVSLDPPGTRTLWADRAGDWLVVLAQYAPGEGLGWHAHDLASFHLTLRGTSDERYWRFDRGKLAGTAQFYGSGVEHRTRFGPGGATVLHINKPTGEPLAGDAMVEPDPRPMLSIMREILTGDRASLVSIEGWCAELEASIVKRSPPHETEWPIWLDRVRQRLFDDPAEGLSVREIAEDEGLNPSHVARTFRERLGVTIGEYLRVRRLQIAADTLLTSKRAIASIATGAGFCDQSHFGRAFSAHYGSTPASLRRELGGVVL
ncbi:MAG: helix-turn-helix transcriptional regulator [Phycisphaera sp.]|nr:helix-turn-helix transcriptional regulator [Phycisphaera sp.]